MSLDRAVTTNRFPSTVASVEAPDYDGNRIAEWMRHIVQIENDNLELLKRHNLHARFLRYEDIVRDRATTLAVRADAVRPDGIPACDAAKRRVGENCRWMESCRGRTLSA